MTEPSPLQQIERTYVRYQGRKLSYFSGCDYFRLASHPEVLAALEKGMQRFGLNVAASRKTTGDHIVYHQLERALASFFGADDALLVSSGYVSNLIAAQAVAGQFSHVLLDQSAHPSLVDAARFLDCPVLRFKSRDATSLGGAVKRCGAGAKIILLTEGMFARDGAAAPLDAYHKVLPRDAWMLVDDAHGAGVLGRTGKGTLEHCGLEGRRVVQTITLSKAFGVYGGAVLCSRELRARMVEHSQMFIGSTPLPLPLAAAALESVRVLRGARALRQRLHRNSSSVKKALRLAGVELPETPGPIVALFPQTTDEFRRLNNALLKAKIFPPWLNYPGGPEGGYFRFAISSEHSRKQLESVVNVLAANAPPPRR